MTDHPGWPDWLAGQDDAAKIRAIVNAVAACFSAPAGGEHDADGKQHCTATMAERFLLRLLAEARQPSPVPSGDRLARRVAELARLQAGWLDGDGVPPDPAVLGLAGDVARELAAKGIAAHLFPVPEGGISLEWGDGTAGVTIEPAGLRDRISEALDESVDSCARCKVCDNQLDAVMAIVAFEVLDRDLRREQADARLEALRADLGAFLGEGPQWHPDGPERAAEDRLREFAAAAGPSGGASGPAPLSADLRRFHAPCDPRECPAAARLAGLENASQKPLPEPVMELLESACGLIQVLFAPFEAGRFDEPATAWLDCYRDLVADFAAAKAGQAAEPEPAPEPVPPLPPGEYGRMELPGFRSHTGWWVPGVLAGQSVMACTDREGVVQAEYIPGPASRFVRLPVPATRAEPLALTVAQQTEADYWGGLDGDPDDGEDADSGTHRPGCHDGNCDGECNDGMPF